MGTKLSTLFLFTILILGMAAYPASINPTLFDESPSNLSFLVAFAEESEDESEDTNDESEDETEIEVEVKNEKAKVKVKLDGEKFRFLVTDDVSESAIIVAIMDKTGLTEDEITSNWEFDIEDEERDDENSEGGDENSEGGDENSEDKSTSKSEKLAKQEIKMASKAEKLVKHEISATANAEDTILELQQKIDQLEERLQKLLDKFESGAYFGKITEPDPTPDSFIITMDGFAVSLDDDTVVSMEGEIFLESIMTRTDSTKLRITGGEVLVGDIFYDFVIGKARLSSSGTSGETDSMIILGQVMDDQGNVNTIRLSLDGTTSLDDFGSESVDFEINSSRSKIASQWIFDGLGVLSTL